MALEDYRSAHTSLLTRARLLSMIREVRNLTQRAWSPMHRLLLLHRGHKRPTVPYLLLLIRRLRLRFVQYFFTLSAIILFYKDLRVLVQYRLNSLL